MVPKKKSKTYYFSVEGETEKWYLEWLEKQINNEPSARFKISIDRKIQKDPVKRVKSLNIVSPVEITHLFDYESDDPVHTRQFIETLDRMKEATTLGKQVKYKLGYSNFTFELWMVLHKLDCNGFLIHRDRYLALINKSYDERYQSLDEFKHEDNFERALRQLTLSHVRNAICRSKSIMQRNKSTGYTLHNYKNYLYYKENPSLTIWESVEKILKDCGLD